MTKEKESPKRLSRREFVKGAAAVAGAGALAGCAPAATPAPDCPPAAECAPCETPWIPTTWDEEADVVVCGYGTTGMPAAIDAHDAGADVLIIDKLDFLGGSCRRCGGGIVGANTIVQRALGIVDDTPDKLYEYLVAVGEGWTDPALHRVLADNAGKNVDWIIEELGGQPVSEWEFSVDDTGEPIHPVPDTTLDEDLPLSLQYGLTYSGTPLHFSAYGLKPVMRCHWFTGDPAAADFTEEYQGMGGQAGPNGGTGLFKTFDDAIKAREIRTMLETGLIELVAGPDREVLGIKALSGGKTLYIKAKKGVVLGTGGWINNEKMVRDYVPESIERIGISRHPLHAHGEGIVAGNAIGGDLINMAIPGSECQGGLRINPKAQVIDVFGNPIPRLYAGGCATGGNIAYKYPVCGSYVGTAVCFGRIGGTNAAAEESWA